MTNGAPASGFGQYFVDQGPKYDKSVRKKRKKRKKKK